MLRDCADEFDIDLSASIMIGDNVTDVEAGIRAGCARNYYLNSREVRDEGFDSLRDVLRVALGTDNS